MKTRRPIIFVGGAIVIVVFFLTSSAPVAAAFDTSKWTWRRPITATAAGTQFVRAPLPLEVLDTSQPSLSDLRVLDASGNLAPFVIQWSRGYESAHLVWKHALLLDPVFQPEKYRRVTADFGRSLRKTRLKITTSGDNYRRRVLIEGGSNGTDWDVVLEDGWLFDVPLPDKHYKVDEVTFPLNSFRYLRVTIFNMPDDPRKIEIPSVEWAEWTEPPAAPLPVEVASKTSSFDEKTHVTTYELDLHYKYVPVAALEVTVTDPFYYRAYELSGRNSEKIQTRRQAETKWETEERDAPWRPISSGVFYRIQGPDNVRESTSIDGLTARYRFLRLRIFEQDNPPLTIPTIAVKRREASVVFQYHPGESYALIGGNPGAGPPSFDLASTQTDLAKRDLPSASIGGSEPLTATPAPGPWNERYSVLLWIALILAVVVVAILIVRNLGKLRSA